MLAEALLKNRVLELVCEKKSEDGKISPVKWELEARPKKTRKISNTLPGLTGVPPA